MSCVIGQRALTKKLEKESTCFAFSEKSETDQKDKISGSEVKLFLKL